MYLIVLIWNRGNKHERFHTYTSPVDMQEVIDKFVIDNNAEYPDYVLYFKTGDDGLPELIARHNIGFAYHARSDVLKVRRIQELLNSGRSPGCVLAKIEGELR